MTRSRHSRSADSPSGGGGQEGGCTTDCRGFVSDLKREQEEAASRKPR